MALTIIIGDLYAWPLGIDSANSRGMSMTTIIGGAIQLYVCIDPETCERVYSLAKLPQNMAKDWEGQSINLINWRIADDRKTVRVEYQTRNDLYAPIITIDLPAEVQRIKLTPPTKSRNWKWNSFWSQWQNVKTGERAYA